MKLDCVFIVCSCDAGVAFLFASAKIKFFLD